MISIVIGTNRENSYSERIALIYYNALIIKGKEVKLIDLRNLPKDFLNTVLYQQNKESAELFQSFQQQIDDSQSIIFIIPEYNGSYPGVLKSFIDALRYPDSLINKDVILVGISAGRSGATKAVQHFKDICIYLKANIFPEYVFLSGISLFVKGNELINLDYYNAINQQVDNFLGQDSLI